MSRQVIDYRISYLFCLISDFGRCASDTNWNADDTDFGELARIFLFCLIFEYRIKKNPR
jgi:hypothetical protein